MKKAIAWLAVLVTTVSLCGCTVNAAENGGIQDIPSETTGLYPPVSQGRMITGCLTGQPLPVVTGCVRPVALVIDIFKNHEGASGADIVYHLGFCSRGDWLLCVFQDVFSVQKIGPVAQWSYAVDMAAVSCAANPIYYTPLGWGPLFACANQVGLEVIGGSADFGVFPNYATWDKETDTLWTSGSLLTVACAAQDIHNTIPADTPGVFCFAESAREVLPGGGMANTVGYTINETTPMRLVYDADNQWYVLCRNDREIADTANGQALYFENALILFGQMNERYTYEITETQMQYEAGGTGYYFYGGRYTEIRWTKGSFEENFTFYDAATGEELALGRGRTYIGIASNTMPGSVTIDGAGRSTS